MQSGDVMARSEASSPTTRLDVDLCIIGAGPGGLAVAAGAAAFGQRVALIEKHKMGGDSLNYGCVPTTALIAAAERAHLMQTSGAFGIEPVMPKVDSVRLSQHIQSVISRISPNDSVERFQGLGVRVIRAAARFIDGGSVSAGDFIIAARRFVIATGSSPLVPSISGLDDVGYFTRQTIFANAGPLDHLIVIGGGSEGLELAQAYRRLGSQVTVVESGRVLASEDPELASQLVDSIRSEGVDVRENTRANSVTRTTSGIRVEVTGGGAVAIEGSHLLIATGRRPNICDLNLAAAGVKFEKDRVIVDRGLRTTNRRIFAIGDVIGVSPSAPVADYQAGIVLRRALFHVPAKFRADRVPRVIFTQPGLAHVGFSEAEALAQNINVRALRWPFRANVRAEAEDEARGHIKVVTDRSGRILGATILGPRAGELIQTWSLAISQRLKINAMTEWIPAHPTLGEAGQRAASRFYVDAAGSPLLRRIIGWLAKFR